VTSVMRFKRKGPQPMRAFFVSRSDDPILERFAF